MLITASIIAIAVNGLMINPAYQWLINQLNLGKPFNCIYCLSWWAGVVYIYTQAFLGTFSPVQVLIPLVASFIATALSRWFDDLPFKIK
ncbi:hypothetical protein ACVW0P_004512 [Mucilaginibacter sp. UYNi724]